jgi:quercetin dioxygenase-like cupin family protein
MPILNYNIITPKEIWPGIKAAFGHSDNVTFGIVTLEKGAIITEHQHPHEQWTCVLEGEFEFTLDGKTHLLTQGMAAHIPPNIPHSAHAITAVKVIDCFYAFQGRFQKIITRSDLPCFKIC